MWPVFVFFVWLLEDVEIAHSWLSNKKLPCPYRFFTRGCSNATIMLNQRNQLPFSVCYRDVRQPYRTSPRTKILPRRALENFAVV